MPKIQTVSYVRGRTQKVVCLRTVGSGEVTDNDLLSVAMDTADETKSSLFGWSFVRDGKFTTITLFTD